jgi:hypothetical protein
LNRKMILLNAVLAAVLVFAGFQWRNVFVAAKEKQRKMLTSRPPAVTPPPFVPLQNQPPVMATGYIQVAQKFLLHPSRNPDLPPPVVEEPPPPPPMPPLPKYHGAMNLDGEAVAILSEKENAPFQEVKAGEMIGQFKLVDVNTRDITFEWRQQQVRKTLNEILDRSSASNNNNNNNASSNAPAPPPPPQIKTQVGPVGEPNQFGTIQCDPNDSYPDGAVVNGRRKVSRSSPFGKACVWEAVGR